MRAQIKAGEWLDFLTKDELRDVLRDWQSELLRGAKFRRRSIQGNVDGAGNLLLPGPSEDMLGPADGFVWAITRLTVTGLTGTQSVQVYVNEPAPSQLLVASLVNDYPTGDRGIVLLSGDELVIAGTALTASAQVTVTMQIKEVPSLMAWAL